MSYLQVTASRPSLHNVSDRYNTLHGLSMQRNAPTNIFNLPNSLKPTIGLSKKCTKLMTCHMLQKIGASRYQQCTPLCLFGGKGEPKKGNADSPWKSIEKAMGGLKKEQSLEDVLRQQMEKQEYEGGDGGGDGGGGGDSGGGGGFGGSEDDFWDDISQVTFAILALIALYIYIIANEKIWTFIGEGMEFLAGKRGPRIRTIMYEFAKLCEKYRKQIPEADPFGLEKLIIHTPTYYDSPMKYRRVFRSELRQFMAENGGPVSDDEMDTTTIDNKDTENDENTKSEDDDDNDNDNDDDNANANANANDNDNDNDNDDDAYGEDDDDDE